MRHGLLGVALLLPAFLLTACAEDQAARIPGQWSRPATPGQTLDADLVSCRSEATEATARAQQIGREEEFGTRPQQNDNIGPILGQMRNFDTTRLYYESVDRCMRSRGYVPIGGR